METFTYGTGKTKINLPKFNQIPFGVMRRIRKESESEQIFAILEALFDMGKIKEADLDRIDQLDMDAVSDLLAEWQKDAGTTVGE